MDNTPDDQPIIVEFSVFPTYKTRLEQFFDNRFNDLKSPNVEISEKARADLKIKLEECLPEGSIDAFGSTLDGKSDQGLLIHNLPERKGFENNPGNPNPEDTYSYHIAQALYEMKKARLIKTAIGIRSSHIDHKSWDLENFIVHRDGIKMSPTIADASTHGEYIVFSSPYNGESAPTEFIQLRRAIKSLPQNVCDKVMVHLNDREQDSGFEYEPMEPGDLNSALKALEKFGHNDPYWVKEVTLMSNPDMPETQQFLDAVKKHSVRKTLEPGDLLLINENNMFHRAYSGDQNKIAKIPPEQPLSRIIMHYAGTRQQPSTAR